MINESDELKKTILKTILKSQVPISTQDISIALKKPWHSIQMRCLKLQLDKKITGFKVGRINLWQTT